MLGYIGLYRRPQQGAVTPGKQGFRKDEHSEESQRI